MVQKQLFRSGVIFIHLFALGTLWGMASSGDGTLKQSIEVPDLRGALHDTDTWAVDHGSSRKTTDGSYWT